MLRNVKSKLISQYHKSEKNKSDDLRVQKPHYVKKAYNIDQTAIKSDVKERINKDKPPYIIDSDDNGISIMLENSDDGDTKYETDNANTDIKPNSIDAYADDGVETVLGNYFKNYKGSHTHDVMNMYKDRKEKNTVNKHKSKQERDIVAKHKNKQEEDKSGNKMKQDNKQSKQEVLGQPYFALPVIMSSPSSTDANLTEQRSDGISQEEMLKLKKKELAHRSYKRGDPQDSKEKRKSGTTHHKKRKGL